MPLLNFHQTCIVSQHTKTVIRLRNRIVLRLHAFAASLAVACFATPSAIAQMQPPAGSSPQVQTNGSSSQAVDIPQTNLTPIAPPPSPPVSNGFGQFDPYGTTPSAQYGGGVAPPIMAPPASVPGTGFGPPPGVGGVPTTGLPSGTTVIGPPTAVLPSGQHGAYGQIAPSPPGGGLIGRIFSRPASSSLQGDFGTSTFSVPSAGAPTFAPPTYGGSGFTGSGLNTGSVYGPPTAYTAPVTPVYPSSIYPSASPSVLFPSGLFEDGALWNEGFVASPMYEAYRLFQGPRLSHEWVSGGSKPSDLSVNTTDVSLAFAFPNFLYFDRPLFIIPSFTLDLWDGPDGITGADLPSSAYSAFLDIGWESDPNQMLSSEVGIRTGVFTDFDTYNSKSWRILGKALVSFRTTPSSTFKAGVYYLDRNSIKLVPAGGFVCYPNPHTKIDLFFPQPKFSHYCRTLGTKDLWWYFAGDYGGGSWTITRTNSTEDSVDINELRAVFGIECGESLGIRAGRRTGFFEVGYVFNREIEYRYNSQDNIKPSDGFMLRAGIGY